MATEKFSPFWLMAQQRGDAAAQREFRAEKRRARSPRQRELMRLFHESRKAAGLE